MYIHPIILTLVLVALTAVMLSQVDVVMATPSTIAFRSRNFFPKGMVYHPSHGFLVGSVGNGHVWKVNDQGQVSEFVTDSRLNDLSSQGLYIDYPRNQLLVGIANSTAANYGYVENAHVAMARVNLDTGAIESFVSLDNVRAENFKGAMFANVLTCDPEGTVYLTESFGGSLWKIDIHGNASVFLSNENWGPEQKYIPGLNGIAYHKDGYLLLGRQGVGRMFKVTLGASPTTTEIVFPDTKRPSGINGFAFKENGNLVSVGKDDNDTPLVYEIESNDNWNTARIIQTVTLSFEEPSSVTARGEEFFVVHSFFNDYFAGRETFYITKVPSPISTTNAGVNRGRVSGFTSVMIMVITLMSILFSL